ncbi:hypothetical protein BH11PLA1_BH11PLA1_20140 [soil metagenome]
MFPFVAVDLVLDLVLNFFASHRLHVSVAQRRIRLARLWVIVLALAALGIILIPTSWLRAAPAPALAKRPPAPNLPAASTAPAISPNELAGVLNAVVPPQKDAPKKVPEVAGAPAPTGEEPAPPTPPAPGVTVRFLAAIIGSGEASASRRAIVAVNDDQRIAAPGDFLNAQAGAADAIKLVSVEQGQIVIDRAGTQETLVLIIPKDRPVMVMPSGNPAAVPGPDGGKDAKGEEAARAERVEREKLAAGERMRRGRAGGKEPPLRGLEGGK